MSPTFSGYTYSTVVSIGDATPFGQAYFARYFDPSTRTMVLARGRPERGKAESRDEWQGRAREEFFRQYVPTAHAILDAFRIVTTEASVVYKRELLLHEPVAVEVRIAELTRASVALSFTYRQAATGTVVADGFQRLVFLDQAGRIIPLPDDLQRCPLAYMNLQALPVRFLHGPSEPVP